MDTPIRQAPLFLTESTLSPEQQLAAAVFACAIADATNPSGSATDRQSARAFLLEDDEMFRFWSTVANINGEAIRKHAWHVLVGNHPNLHTFTAA